jgi:phosphotriesterase-related protein
MSVGVVRTVLGDIDPAELGVTLTHEHLLLTFGRWRREAGVTIVPTDVPDDPRAYQPITLETVGWIRRYGSRLPENYGLHEEDVATAELERFRAAGGHCVVDATNPDLGRNSAALARISRSTGIHIVAGCGRYVAAHHPPDMVRRTEAQLAEEIIDDITEGCDGSRVRAGVIGEIGCSAPLHADERRALRAAVHAQHVTGAALLVHPGRDSSSPREIMACIVEAGGDPERVIMSHLDRTLFDIRDMLALAETGCYLEFDLFGKENFPYRPAHHVYVPNDAGRVDYLCQLMAVGYGDKLVIAQDITSKMRLVKYGGDGYAHILENVLPIMRGKGMTDADIDTILVRNPARVLQLGAMSPQRTPVV